MALPTTKRRTRRQSLAIVSSCHSGRNPHIRNGCFRKSLPSALPLFLSLPDWLEGLQHRPRPRERIVDRGHLDAQHAGLALGDADPLLDDGPTRVARACGGSRARACRSGRRRRYRAIARSSIPGTRSHRSSARAARRCRCGAMKNRSARTAGVSPFEFLILPNVTYMTSFVACPAAGRCRRYQGRAALRASHFRPGLKYVRSGGGWFGFMGMSLSSPLNM
jgi:hypothetical protein